VVLLNAHSSSKVTIHNGLRFAPPLAELQLALAILRPRVVLLIKGAGRHF